MTTRVVGNAIIHPSSARLTGSLRNIEFGGGGSCPAVIAHLNFEWVKLDSALDSGEQADIAALRLMMRDYFHAAESCTDLRNVIWYELSTNGAGRVDSVKARIVAVIAGIERPMWARWSQARSAFTSGEQSELDAVVAFLTAHLESEEPL